MFRISREKTLNISADRLWQVVTDFPSYRHWNPYVRVEGSIRSHGRLLYSVRIKPEGRFVTVEPKVVDLTPPNRLMLRAGLSYLLSFEEKIEIIPDEGRCRFVHTLSLNGILSILPSKKVLRNFEIILDGIGEGLSRYVSQNMSRMGVRSRNGSHPGRR